MNNPRLKAEKEAQKNKLAASYHELLEEFSSKELRTVGNYTLGRLLGKGSFGKVYLATHNLTNGSKVVLKSAHKNDANLAREIHHHRQFVHPHIARLYEVIVTENLVWLVLEYCPGDELYNYLLGHGALPADKVQRMFTQLVGAVSYIHNLNCVHRDLKLENILLDKHENVKLVDFGFTREYDGKTNYLQTFCGTICYSAPEMLKGEKYAGEKVDVWSLGIILFALLTGELPFDDDDELVTKHKILQQEVTFPDTFPEEAKALVGKLLSKRPLLRPSLAEILNDPFLREHAPGQQVILKLTRPAPFTTPLETDVLQRMRSAGVDIDKVIENVLAQRCDALAGWWSLLLEKEERKEHRRERKKREKEEKIARRISAASLLRASMLEGVTEEVGERRADLSAPVTPMRGRKERRSFPNPQLVIPDLPRLPEHQVIVTPGSATPPLPLEKDSVRSVSTSRPRPMPASSSNNKVERRRSRSSTLQLAVNSQLTQGQGVSKRRGRRRQLGFLGQLASIKHWFMENTKRTRSPNIKGGKSTTSLHKNKDAVASKSHLPQNGQIVSPAITTPNKPLPTPNINGATAATATYRSNRSSLSPAPLTPRASYRRSSAGLRGRKSTSSSVSSIRSMHHVHSHSKTSSTSSRSESVQSAALNRNSRSPHSSIKLLPATPTGSSIPNNVRLVRGSPAPIHIPPVAFGSGGPMGAQSPNPFSEQFRPLNSPGLVFAKRKKTPFRGPMLGHPSGVRSREGSRSGSQPRRHSRLIIEEEEEEVDDDDEDVEEVDEFSPSSSAINSPGIDAEAEEGPTLDQAGFDVGASTSRTAQQGRESVEKQSPRTVDSGNKNLPFSPHISTQSQSPEAQTSRTSGDTLVRNTSKGSAAAPRAAGNSALPTITTTTTGSRPSTAATTATGGRLGSSSGWVDFSPSTDADGGLLPDVMAAGTKATSSSS